MATAARLFGAAEALREAIQAPMSSTDCGDHEIQVAELRAAMGEETLTATWGEGRAMPVERAIELALREAVRATA